MRGLGGVPTFCAPPKKTQKINKKASHLVEGLGHLSQEEFGHLHRLVHRQVEVGVGDVLLDPPRQLAPLVRPGKTLRQGGGHEKEFSVFFYFFNPPPRQLAPTLSAKTMRP